MEPNPASARRAQRRDNVRVEVQWPFQLRARVGTPIQATLVDVSGMGCGFISQSRLNMNQMVEIELEFPGGWVLTTDVAVRFVQATGDGDRSIIGTSFETLLSGDLDRIVKALFVEQRRQLATRVA